jgi:histone-lysine N-methyltransferase SETMAR
MSEIQLAQRHYIQTAVLAGKSFSVIHADLQCAYGTYCLSKTRVFSWFQQFSQGRETITDLPRTGAPVTVRTHETITAVRALVSANSRVTQLQIAQTLHISEGSVHRVLTDDLRLRRISAKWVPYSLTPTQKALRLAYCQQMLKEMQRRGSRFFSELVTLDETWIYFETPKLPQQMSAWQDESAPPPHLSRLKSRGTKVMVGVCFWSGGVLANVPLPAGESYNSTFYCHKVLPTVTRNIQSKRPKCGWNGLKFIHDNAPVHKAANVLRYFDRHGISVEDHPPYSPDLSPCDYWLFPAAKMKMRSYPIGQEEVKDKRSHILHQWEKALNSLHSAHFLHALQDLETRCTKCIKANGDYFE